MSLPFVIVLSLIFASLLSFALTFRFFLHYYTLARNFSIQKQENRRRYRTAGILLVACGVIFLGALSYLIYQQDSLYQGNTAPTAAPDRPDGTTIPPPATGLTATLTTALPEATPTQTVTPEAQTAKIGNTGGAGVNVRANPGLSATILTLLPDESRVTLTEDVQEVDGFTWQKVILTDGRQGWIVTNFLIP